MLLAFATLLCNSLSMGPSKWKDYISNCTQKSFGSYCRVGDALFSEQVHCTQPAVQNCCPDKMNQSSVSSDVFMSATPFCPTWRSLKLSAYLIPPKMTEWLGRLMMSPRLLHHKLSSNLMCKKVLRKNN